MKSLFCTAGVFLGLSCSALAHVTLHVEATGLGNEIRRVEYFPEEARCSLIKQSGDEQISLFYTLKNGYAVQYYNVAMDRQNPLETHRSYAAERFWRERQLGFVTSEGEVGKWRSQDNQQITGLIHWQATFYQIVFGEVRMESGRGEAPRVLLDANDWNDDIIDHFSECMVFLSDQINTTRRSWLPFAWLHSWHDSWRM